MAAPTTIAVAELKGILKMLQDSRPNLKVDASHEMENVRELLLWSRPLFSDNFVRGGALAYVIAALTTVRLHLETGECLQIAHWGDYATLDEPGEPSRPFQENLGLLRGLDVKVHELRDGIKWISSLKLPDDGSVATAAFKSARSCLCDALVNIVYALNVG